MSLVCCTCACRRGCRLLFKFVLRGREYLARQLLRESISFTQADNLLLTAIGDFAGAQQLSDQLVTRKMKTFLDMLARRAESLAGT